LPGGYPLKQHESKMQAAVYHRYGPPSVVTLS